MSAEVEEHGGIIDPEAEVKKLQDLVRKLERQNQVLRNNRNQKDSQANVISSKIEADCDQTVSKFDRTSDSVSSETDRQKDRLQNLTLEDVEIIDLERSESGEEEDTWLYMSPKRPSPAQQRISPARWVRQEFEHPSPEVETAKRSLLYKLDEVSKVPRSVSSGSSSSGSTPTLTPVGQKENPSSPASGSQATTATSNGVPAIRQPLMPGLGTRVNSNTFTRVRKTRQHEGLSSSAVDQPCSTSPRLSPRSGSPRASPEPQQHRVPARVQPQVDHVDSHNNNGESEEERAGHMHKLDDVVDVQVLARMQEESLRQSFNSPFTSPRKGSRSGLNRSGSGAVMFSVGDAAGENNSSHSSARSSPGRFDGDAYQATGQSSNSLASAGTSSHSSSPPDSPYGSQYLDHRQHQNVHMPDGHRRSMPNLVGIRQLGNSYSHQSDPRLSARKAPSPSRIQNAQLRAGRIPTAASGPSPSAAARQASPGRALSPQRSGIPTPSRSGIPRPGSASKLPTPRKSSIPGPALRRSSPRRGDDSWKEGCY